MNRTEHIKRQPALEPKNLTPDLGEYVGQWVALTDFSPDSEVICSGNSPRGVYDCARGKGHDAPAVLLVSTNLGQIKIL